MFNTMRIFQNIRNLFELYLENYHLNKKLIPLNIIIDLTPTPTCFLS